MNLRRNYNKKVVGETVRLWGEVGEVLEKPATGCGGDKVRGRGKEVRRIENKRRIYSMGEERFGGKRGRTGYRDYQPWGLRCYFKGVYVGEDHTCATCVKAMMTHLFVRVCVLK